MVLSFVISTLIGLCSEMLAYDYKSTMKWIWQKTFNWSRQRGALLHTELQNLWMIVIFKFHWQLIGQKLVLLTCLISYPLHRLLRTKRLQRRVSFTGFIERFCAGKGAQSNASCHQHLPHSFSDTGISDTWWWDHPIKLTPNEKI